MNSRLMATAAIAAVWMAAAGALPASADPIQQIQISDLTEGSPTFTARLGPGFISSQTATLEQLRLSGDLIERSVNSSQALTSSVALREGLGGPVSDFLTLHVDATDCSHAAQTGHCDQLFTINFESDGAANFTSDLAGLTLAGSIVEDGTFQELSGLLGIDPNVFSIQAQSDVPEPASLIVLGTALIGFGVIRRRRRTG